MSDDLERVRQLVQELREAGGNPGPTIERLLEIADELEAIADAIEQGG